MFGGAEGDDAPSDTNNLEGGVSFRFNFAVKGESGGGGGEEVEGKKGEDEEQQQQRLASSSVTTKPSAPAFEVVPDAVDVGSLQLDAVDLALPSGPLLKVRVSGPSAIAHSDLVPGIYEGGFKLWEGAVDLARLLAEEVIEEERKTAPSSSSPPPPAQTLPLVPLDPHLPRWLPGASRPPSIHGARVLELGCGSALPSLVAAKAAARRKKKGGGGRGETRRGPSSVTLCDFNAEVLRGCTAANVAANFKRDEYSSGKEGETAFFRYFAGDWGNLWKAIEDSSSSSSAAASSFDLILAAEVTYSPESYLPLADAIADLLAPPPARSAALVAAKRHYFGVGGNVEGFIKTVTQRGRLRVEKVAVVEGPLPRDVLLLTRI